MTLQSGASAKPTPLVRAEATFSKVPDMHWKIHQIQTRNCTSAASTVQLWTWCEEEGSLKHLLLSNMQWMHLQCPADFDVKLKDVAEVRASVQSWRVRLVMNEPATHEQQEAPREDVMVVFEGRTTVQCFLQFSFATIKTWLCLNNNRKLIIKLPFGRASGWGLSLLTLLSIAL